MAAPTPDHVRQRVRELAERGLSRRAIGRELDMSHSTVGKILAGGPFSGERQGAPNIPPSTYNVDQPPPPPKELKYDPRYHGHTFRASAAPQAIDGWDVERIRDAITLHDQGMFVESSQLSVVATRFAPVQAALEQALAPVLGLPRFVQGGNRGWSRILREEVETQLAPRGGLTPSPYFPPSLWGSMQFDLVFMGFSVLQHVHGDEDPETGVRQIFTRRWPSWAVQEDSWRQTYQAITTEGPVDIVNGDGKFTILGDTVEPHKSGAIRALGLEVLDGMLVKQARASYIERYGNPKWVATMPQGVNTKSPEGDDFFAAIQTIQGPDGVGIFPFGSEYKVEAMAAQQAAVFKDALDNVWQFIAAIILGTDGTMSPSTGVYSAPIFAGVRRDIVHRRLMAMVRGVNLGHVAPWLRFNYAATINSTKGWVEPVLEIPLPDPEADQRIKSAAERRLKLTEIVNAERETGFEVTQERVNELARMLDVNPPPKLADIEEPQQDDEHRYADVRSMAAHVAALEAKAQWVQTQADVAALKRVIDDKADHSAVDAASTDIAALDAKKADREELNCLATKDDVAAVSARSESATETASAAHKEALVARTRADAAQEQVEASRAETSAEIILLRQEVDVARRERAAAAARVQALTARVQALDAQVKAASEVEQKTDDAEAADENTEPAFDAGDTEENESE